MSDPDYSIRYLSICLAGIFILILGSCNSTKYIAEDQYLLERYKVKIDKEKVDVKELNPLLSPKSNIRIFGFKLQLALYNLSGEKESRCNRWLRTIGEKPVLYDKEEASRNTRLIVQYMRDKGYYGVEVSDSVSFRRRKARVCYNIQAGESYRIRLSYYIFDDTHLASHILGDTIHSLLRPGDILDFDLMKDEKVRITTLLRNLGYFNFSEENIHYKIDTLRSTRQVDLSIRIKKFHFITNEGLKLLLPHRKYRIEEVLIYQCYDPKKANADFKDYVENLTRSNYGKFVFLLPGKYKSDKDVISEAVSIKTGELYCYEKVIQSDSLLSSLRISKSVDINFVEKDFSYITDQENYPLICHIKLEPRDDYKLIHFGFGFGFNTMDFGFTRPDIRFDSIYFADVSKPSPGFQVSIVSDLRMGDRLSLRFLPGITFGARDISFYSDPDSLVGQPQTIESNFLDFPLLVKYKASRVNNYRPYLIGGINMRYDMAARTDYEEGGPWVRLKPMDFFVEFGFGIDFFLQYFKFSPELKVSAGFRDVLVHDPAGVLGHYANSIDRLNSYLVMLCFYFE